jgi:phage host-nuclease inhibitor protein Gam
MGDEATAPAHARSNLDRDRHQLRNRTEIPDGLDERNRSGQSGRRQQNEGTASMSKKFARIKTEAAVFVPASRIEADAAIAEIGKLQRQRETLQTAMNEQMAAVKTSHEAQAKPLAEAIKVLSSGVQTWSEANRVDLTRDGKVKTVKLGAGEIRWRTRPPSVVVRAAEKVIEALKRLGLTRFIRTKEEIDKEAILADPSAVCDVKGLTISQGEDFVIVPFETSLEEVA